MERLPVGSFRATALLKRDAFSRTERGLWDAGGGAVEATRRDARAAPLLLRPLARALVGREARALVRLAGVPGVPKLLARGRGRWPAWLVRTWIDGAPLDAAPPPAGWFDAAHALLTALHAAGVAHNDLHKEANWLVTREGGAAVLDFQLACRRGNGRFARMLVREDLRHLLKHQRKYAPATLTEAQTALLRRPGAVARVHRRTTKRLYNLLTRRLLRWRDAEGA